MPRPEDAAGPAGGGGAVPSASGSPALAMGPAAEAGGESGAGVGVGGGVGGEVGGGGGGAAGLRLAVGESLERLEALQDDVEQLVEGVGRRVTDSLRAMYAELRRDLLAARRLHHALFPAPGRVGPLEFSYLCAPAQEIGGDYLHAHTSCRGGRAALTLTVLDVTGHGIGAAMAVHELHGVLSRLATECGSLSPRRVIRTLNRAVLAGLAPRAVFASAVCVRAQAGGGLEWASAGHPPAVVRRADGSVERLEATCAMLGVEEDAVFRPEPRRVGFEAGDTVLLCTDGAADGATASGERLGISGLCRVLERGFAATRGWRPEAVLRHLNELRGGPSPDDTLIVRLRHGGSGPEPAAA